MTLEEKLKQLIKEDGILTEEEGAGVIEICYSPEERQKEWDGDEEHALELLAMKIEFADYIFRISGNVPPYISIERFKEILYEKCT